MTLVEGAGVHRINVASGFWTAKEALAKVLTTGLMAPFQVYNLAEFRLTVQEPGKGCCRASLNTKRQFGLARPTRSRLFYPNERRWV
jgi:phosphopantetheinyl transferase (holo-ACP synthase)